MRFAVIMAGGSGTRFWPESTSSLPKQFLKLSGEQSLIRSTYERICGIVPSERILVVTSFQHVQLVAQEIPEIPLSNIVSETRGRNTGPCLVLAAEIISKIDPKASMLVVAADHLITDIELFESTIEQGFDYAEQNSCLLTLGLKPSFPSTGYGYIHLGERLGKENESEINESEIFEVQAFIEKPELEKAQGLVDGGQHLWNSGMFIWQNNVFLEAAKKHMPEVYKVFELVRKTEKVSTTVINEVYEACPSISVDFGVMEKADNVVVIRADFSWSDVGDWKAVHELMEKDAEGNTGSANSVFVGSKDSMIRGTKKPIVLVGLDRVVVVETEKAILVCDLDKAQLVKQAVEKLPNELK